MGEIDKPPVPIVTVVGKKDIRLKILKLFLNRVKLLSSRERSRILKILEYLLLPRHALPKHILEGKPRIEEEWLQKQDKLEKDR